MKIQTYGNTHYILNKGRIIADFADLKAAEALLKANTQSTAPSKKPQTKKTAPPEFSAFGYPVSQMQKGTK